MNKLKHHNRKAILAKASEYWQLGNALEAGKLIFESLPKETRPKWAANILHSVLRYSGISNCLIDKVLTIAKQSDDWRKAHETFCSVRRLTLEMEQGKPVGFQETLLLSHLLLAELVAKVIYNATNPVDEFDQDSGWWIAVILKDIIELIKSGEFEAMIWLALCSACEAEQVEEKGIGDVI